METSDEVALQPRKEWYIYYYVLLYSYFQLMFGFMRFNKINKWDLDPNLILLARFITCQLDNKQDYISYISMACMRCLFLNTHMTYVYMCVCIYIYKHRERERERLINKLINGNGW